MTINPTAHLTVCCILYRPLLSYHSPSIFYFLFFPQMVTLLHRKEINKSMRIISGSTITGAASKQLVDAVRCCFLLYSENICPSDTNMKPGSLLHTWLTSQAIWVCRYKWIQSELTHPRCVALLKVWWRYNVLYQNAVHAYLSEQFIPHFTWIYCVTLMILGYRHWYYSIL